MSGGAEGAVWSLQTPNVEITLVIAVIADLTSADLKAAPPPLLTLICWSPQQLVWGQEVHFAAS